MTTPVADGPILLEAFRAWSINQIVAHPHAGETPFESWLRMGWEVQSDRKTIKAVKIGGAAVITVRIYLEGNSAGLSPSIARTVETGDEMETYLWPSKVG